MDYKSFDIKQLLNLPQWQLLQDTVAQATGFAIVTVDFKGKPITRHSMLRPFCKAMREYPNTSCYCEMCDSRGGLEAARKDSPYIYHCYCGIVDIAIPIIIGNYYMGALMAGQIRQNDVSLERIVHSANSEVLQTDPALHELYNRIPIINIRQIQNIANMLFQLCSYVSNNTAEQYIEMEQLEFRPRPLYQPPEESKKSPEIQPDAEHKISEKAPQMMTRNRALIDKNSILKPALDYIFSNRGEPVTQRQMADLCHVSASYFSHLFTKTMGEGFSCFLARLKIEWSKTMLENTALTVSQISDQLGFSSSGYYIKTFKKFEHITPAAYRKSYAGHTMNA